MPYGSLDTVGILDNVLRTGRGIQVECTGCPGLHRFTHDEIAALADKVGRDYNLLNRRCKCRLTPGCEGWNRFFFLSGVYRPLFTPEHSVRWGR
ncbi:hypothetical protein [Novosphingobium sp. Leaf2]|uniref:hypothetical protein n=1 Tax=Novosphingobium sp. Leaf2 TaxID=1735670 RepID=UPI000701EBA3|nr:hypothetical protein [Novosphingobium sp. Leaf2]KQM18368.1 hypothetical protein ASE49_09155 [Novosphingobium sp. Leaf2]